MANGPLVSCIVPVFNAEQYLAEALDSILQQTYRPLEIIVVDDGSTDTSADIVATRYGEQVLYCKQANAGPAAARNTGLSLVKGEFVAFLDADDLWHKDKLARQIARFHRRPDLEACITHLKNFWVPELKDEEHRLKGHPCTKEPPGYVCQTLMARRELFAQIGAFDASLRTAEDVEWFSRARDRRVVLEIVPEVLVYRRMHGANLSYALHYGTGRDDMLRVVQARLKRMRQDHCHEAEATGVDVLGPDVAPGHKTKSTE